jgi:UDP-3-O-[3-hydroxymyristoyl] N-acetylglucosamine deacetylase
VLAALSGLGVDNAVIEIDGPEVPILDGSAGPFVATIDQVGLRTLPAPRRYMQVLKTVRVAQDGAYGELRPHPEGFRIELEIDFDHPLIGRQEIALNLEPDAFRRELARARTFGFMRDVAKLWNAGYALGASFENTLVVTENRVLNPDGLRFADEFARHKALDAIGDLALAGAPMLGVYRSVRGGHRLNHAVLSALMADPSAWRLVDASDMRREAPRRVIRGHADVAAARVAPAYGPDVS